MRLESHERNRSYIMTKMNKCYIWMVYNVGDDKDKQLEFIDIVSCIYHLFL